MPPPTTLKRGLRNESGSYGKQMKFYSKQNPYYSDISSDEEEKEEDADVYKPNYNDMSSSDEDEDKEVNKDEKVEEVNPKPKLILKLNRKKDSVSANLKDEWDLPEVSITQITEKEQKEKIKMEGKIEQNREKVRLILESNKQSDLGFLKSSIPISDLNIVCLDRKYGKWMVTRRFIYAALICLCKLSFHVTFHIIQEINAESADTFDRLIKGIENESRTFLCIDNANYADKPVFNLYRNFASQMLKICELLRNLMNFEIELREPANSVLKFFKFDSKIDLINDTFENLYTISLLDCNFHDVHLSPKKKSLVRVEENILNEMLYFNFNLNKKGELIFPVKLIKSIVAKNTYNDLAPDIKTDMSLFPLTLTFSVNKPLKKVFTDNRVVKKYVDVKSYYF